MNCMLQFARNFPRMCRNYAPTVSAIIIKQKPNYSNVYTKSMYYSLLVSPR